MTANAMPSDQASRSRIALRASGTTDTSRICRLPLASFPGLARQSSPVPYRRITLVGMSAAWVPGSRPGTIRRGRRPLSKRPRKRESISDPAAFSGSPLLRGIRFLDWAAGTPHLAGKAGYASGPVTAPMTQPHPSLRREYPRDEAIRRRDRWVWLDCFASLAMTVRSRLDASLRSQ